MSLLIYGCYGYTGRLIVAEAVRQGLRPVLAGRDAEKCRVVAEPYGLEWHAISLEEKEKLEDILRGCKVVIHAAGPFSRTWEPMFNACLKTGTHYLDITGELEVFRNIRERNADAVDAGIMAVPGCGADVVPTDCAATLAFRALPDATQIRIGIKTTGGAFSHGTALTALESLGEMGTVLKDGKLESVRTGSYRCRMDMGKGECEMVGIPMGELITVNQSTGVKNIEVYFSFPPAMRWLMRNGRWTNSLLRTAWVRGLMRRLIRMQPEGPDERQLREGRTFVRAEARNDSGKMEYVILETMQGYALTALATVAAARAVMSGQVKPGFHSPTTAFGTEFMLGLGGKESVKVRRAARA